MLSRMRIEFTIEPWVEGGHPPYVVAAVSTAEASGLDIDLGPFGTGVEGPADELYRLVPSVLEAAMTAGAERVSLQISWVPDR
ncbi:MAG: hypothetical protein CL466_13065 [Acidimicrobiaceae bacterium]|nr:hypothetical protein [Acidimicrobiaceae bacterium]MBJ32309.1 hypothetical protein [Acidimicrobiaceae bacterium]|tara:strand:+ start:961 stop:1209 length:249 start_codon:yes stop_codon:yes gene_type:complete